MGKSLSLKLFTDNDSDLEGLEENEKFLRQNTRDILRHLWKGGGEKSAPGTFSFQALLKLYRERKLNFAFYQALFVENDPYFLKAARMEVQSALNHLLQQLQESGAVSEENQGRIQLAINNILAIYAMFCPNPHEELSIPTLIEKKWHAASFTITPIELTPTKGAWLNVFNEGDRLYSYGLTPKNDTLPSILLHAGTGWLTAQGAMAQYLADIWPNKTPGEILFEWSAKRIDDWIDKQKKEVHSIGVSLGGALAYLSAMHRPDKVRYASCLNPPGMHKLYPASHPLFGAYQTGESKPTIIIQRQQNDLVSKCGQFEDDFHCVQVRLKQRQSRGFQGLFQAHAQSHVCFDEVEIETKETMSHENASLARKQNNLWLYQVTRIIFFYTILMPITLFWRPLKRFIQKHAFEIVLFTLALLLISAVPPFSSLLALPFIPWLGTTLLSAALPSLAISQVLSGLVHYGYDWVFNQKKQLNAYVASIKAMTWTERFYELSNVLTLGLLGVISKAIRRFILNPLHHWTHERQTTPSIFNPLPETNGQAFADHQDTSFSTKLEVVSLIGLFYLVATPIKLLCIELPKTLFYRLPKAIFSRCTTTKDAESQTVDDAPKATASINSRKRTAWSYKKLFCCIGTEDNLDTGEDDRFSPSPVP